MLVEYFNRPLEYIQFAECWQFNSIRSVIKFVAERERVGEDDVTLRLQSDDKGCSESYKVLVNKDGKVSSLSFCRIFP